MFQSIDSTNRKMDRLKTFIINEDLHIRNGDVKTALIKFLKLKEHIGNIGNDLHFLASCLASSFLKERHHVTIDLTKAAGRAGLDIKSEEIVAEIKTTIPYLENDFGAAQKREIRKDLERLENSPEKHKYFFVVDDRTERILRHKYSKNYPSVKIVNLLNVSSSINDP